MRDKGDEYSPPMARSIHHKDQFWRRAEKVSLTMEREVEKWRKRICVCEIRKGVVAT